MDAVIETIIILACLSFAIRLFGHYISLPQYMLDKKTFENMKYLAEKYGDRPFTELTNFFSRKSIVVEFVIMIILFIAMISISNWKIIAGTIIIYLVILLPSIKFMPPVNLYDKGYSTKSWVIQILGYVLAILVSIAFLH
jgi:hypothetical protein